jgi:hypothetical protein
VNQLLENCKTPHGHGASGAWRAMAARAHLGAAPLRLAQGFFTPPAVLAAPSRS